MLRDPAQDDRLAATPSLITYAPWLMIYPLRGFALGVGLMFLGLLALAFKALISLPLLLPASFWALHYLLQIIERSSQGQATPPPLSMDVVLLNLKQSFTAALLPALLLGLHHWGWVKLAWALSWLLPAYLWLVALENSVSAAFNPLAWLKILLALHGFYPLVWGLGWLALQNLWLAPFGLMLTAHLLGYLAYHRHAALAFTPEVSDPAQRQRQQHQEATLKQWLRDIHQHQQAQDLPAALAVLQRPLVGLDNLQSFHADLYSALITQGQPEVRLRHGQQFVAWLMQKKQWQRAFEVAQSSWQHDNRFYLESPALDLLLSHHGQAAQASLWRTRLSFSS